MMAILIVAVLTMMLMPASVFAEYLGTLTVHFTFTGIPEGQRARVIVGGTEYYGINGDTPTFDNIDGSRVWVLPVSEEAAKSALQSLNQYPNVVRVDDIEGYDKTVTVTVNSLDYSTHNADVTYNVAYTPTPPSITINRDSSYSGELGSNSNATYTVYKIFSADILSDPTVGANGVTTIPGTANYYVTSQDQANGIATNTEMAAIFNLTPAATDVTADRWYVTLKNSDTSADTIAAAMNSLISDDTYGSYFPATATKEMTGSTLTFRDGITAGYYLIKSNLGTNLAVQTLSPVTINEKNTYPTVDKEVDESDESAQIGDIVTFTVELKVPDGADKTITITDTYTAGLTPIVAQNTDSNEAYYVDPTTTPSIDGQVYITAVDGSDTPEPVLDFTSSNPTNGTFTISLTQEQVEALKGKTVTFTYYAIINSSAVVQRANANTNKVKLDYGADYTSTEDTVDVKTQQIKLTKYDGSDTTNKTPIAGAIFELRDGNGNVVHLVYLSDTSYRVATESEAHVDPKSFNNGDTPIANDVYCDVLTVAGTGNDILVNGLDANVTYSWYELKAPTGYNPVGAATPVTPATSSVVASEIANNQGATLPSTGGIGTTIFYILGAILVIGGGVVLVTRRRIG